MNNRLCKLLGIQYPIVQGAMQWLALPELAAAVSEGGGLGIVSAAIYSGKEELAEAIRRTRALTAKPFAVNVSILPSLVNKAKIDGYIEAILEEKPSVVETSGQSPAEYLPALRASGLKVIHKVPSAKFARKGCELGVDAITVVGFECGGHPGKSDVGTMVKIAKVARESPIPVIAGGGIADGAGLAAALCLGADGVIMGTRFVAAKECAIHPSFHAALCSATEEDTAIVERSIMPLRVWNNAATKKVLQMEAAGPVSEEELSKVISGALTKIAYENGDFENCAFPMGQCAGLIDEVLPAADIIRRIVEEARLTLSKAADKL